MKKISIVMATYNGARYIREQIDSIISNEGFDEIIEDFIISDDHSNDETFEILKEYENKIKKIKVYKNNKKGVKNNFLNGIDKASGYYIMLSDQDDIWHNKKIKKMYCKIEAIVNSSKSGIPVLVFSDSNIVDDELNIIDSSFFNYYSIEPRMTTLENLLVKNVCQGCVTVFNRELIEHIKLDNIKDWYMHDWWFIMTASVYGIVDFIDEPLINYRIHSNNVAGGLRRGVGSKFKNSKKLIDIYKRETEKICNQAITFLHDNHLDYSIFRVVDIFYAENTFLRKIMVIVYYFYFSSFIRKIKKLK